MAQSQLEYRFLVRTRRFIVPGVLETLSDQGPVVREALDKIAAELRPSLDSLDGGGWVIQSHSVDFYSGLIVVTFLLARRIGTTGPVSGEGLG